MASTEPGKPHSECLPLSEPQRSQCERETLRGPTSQGCERPGPIAAGEASGVMPGPAGGWGWGWGAGGDGGGTQP